MTLVDTFVATRPTATTRAGVADLQAPVAPRVHGLLLDDQLVKTISSRFARLFAAAGVTESAALLVVRQFDEGQAPREPLTDRAMVAARAQSIFVALCGGFTPKLKEGIEGAGESSTLSQKFVRHGILELIQRAVLEDLSPAGQDLPARKVQNAVSLANGLLQRGWMFVQAPVQAPLPPEPDSKAGKEQNGQSTHQDSLASVSVRRAGLLGVEALEEALKYLRWAQDRGLSVGEKLAPLIQRTIAVLSDLEQHGQKIVKWHQWLEGQVGSRKFVMAAVAALARAKDEAGDRVNKIQDLIAAGLDHGAQTTVQNLVTEQLASGLSQRATPSLGAQFRKLVAEGEGVLTTVEALVPSGESPVLRVSGLSSALSEGLFSAIEDGLRAGRALIGQLVAAEKFSREEARAALYSRIIGGLHKGAGRRTGQAKGKTESPAPTEPEQNHGQWFEARGSTAEILEGLLSARRSVLCKLSIFGQVHQGAIVFNLLGLSGRLINVDTEVSVDFRLFDVESVRWSSIRWVDTPEKGDSQSR